MKVIDKDVLIDSITKLDIDDAHKDIFIDTVQKAEVIGRILPWKPYTKFLPCVCGKNSRGLWYGKDGCFYQCNGCGRKSPWAPTKEGAKMAWNDMITQLMIEDESEEE